MREYLFVIVIAALMTYAFTPLMRTLAVRTGAYTAVRDRDVHHPDPAPGWCAISWLAAAPGGRSAALRQLFDRTRSAGLIGAAIICLIGRSTTSRTSTGSSSSGASSSPPACWPSTPCSSTRCRSAPGHPAAVHPRRADVLVVLVSTNAVNFIDGLDGWRAGWSGSRHCRSSAMPTSSPASTTRRTSSTAALISAAVVGCARASSRTTSSGGSSWETPAPCSSVCSWPPRRSRSPARWSVPTSAPTVAATLLPLVVRSRSSCCRSSTSSGR